MKNIKEHIKNNQYKPIYLLYGQEGYLKDLYKKKLKDGILGKDDGMNYSYFEGKSVDVNKVMQISETLPFFHDKRLVVIENSGLFKSQSDLADYIKEMSATTHIIFVETEIDKRNRLYKAVKDKGTISEMNGLDEGNLKLWVASILAKDKKKITNNTLLYLLDKTGTDMENINSELEKLICYAIDRDVITNEDIDAVCITQITNKIFNMIDAIASKRQNAALAYYFDLIQLKEKPLSILFLITRHFNLLMQVKDLNRLGYNNTVISQKTGLPPFAINKYNTQSKHFKMGELKDVLEYCADVEEKVKKGRLIDQMGVELLIVQFSK